MDREALKIALNHLPLGGLRAFDSIGSTNDEAIAWADSGCKDFSLVIADEQTSGRGRFSRKWITTPGSSLAFSLILIPTPAEKENLPLFAPLCGVAVWQALHREYGLPVEIKWPNDLLLRHQKCAGILVEAAWTGADLKGVVLGIGINISQGSLPPTEFQMFPATFLEAATTNPVDRYRLLASVLEAIREARPMLGKKELIDTWQDHLAFKNEWVTIVQSPKPSIMGVIKGIDPHGRLILTRKDGSAVKVEAGDVHLRLSA